MEEDEEEGSRGVSDEQPPVQWSVHRCPTCHRPLQRTANAGSRGGRRAGLRWAVWGPPCAQLLGPSVRVRLRAEEDRAGAEHWDRATSVGAGPAGPAPHLCSELLPATSVAVPPSTLHTPRSSSRVSAQLTRTRCASSRLAVPRASYSSSVISSLLPSRSAGEPMKRVE